MQQHFPADSGISKLDSAKIPFVTPKLHKGMHFTFEGARALKRGGAPLPKQLVMRLIGAITSLPKQVVLTMQLSAILLFAVCLQVCAAGYSQTVSFTGKDVPLKEVLAAVKKQTGFGVFYASGEKATLEGVGNVTVDVKNVALDVFLKTCLKALPLEYSLEGTTIFIRKKTTSSILANKHLSDAPLTEIKGRITNNKGEPLVNANIVVKRTSRGTVTDANGNFTLHNVNKEDILQISFIGYKTQTVVVHERTNFTLVMETTANELDKMVVQAYGQTSQRLATGNIGVVRAEDIAKQPVMNVLQAIQGHVAGVVVTNNSGYASGSVKVEVRGRNSIGDFPTDPLYIIDGVPLTILDLQNRDNYSNGSQGTIQSGIPSPATGQSPLFSLNPSDIESIEVLKDADATAIYGSRGANGVILITTKKGKTGKSHLDINIYQGMSKVLRYYHLLNTKQYVAMREEALKNDGLTEDINNSPDLVSWGKSRYTDWQNFLWGGMGKVTDAQTSLSGGDNRASFRIAASYRSQREIQTYSGSNTRGTVSFNLNYKSLNQKFSSIFSGAYTYTSVNLISLPGSINLAPNAPPVWDNIGKLNYTGWAPLDGSFPFGSLLQPYNSKTNFLNSNINLSYETAKGLFIKANLGYNDIRTDQKYSAPIAAQNPSYNPTGSLNLGYTNLHNIIIEPQIEYTTFINKGRLNILTGASVQANSTSSAILFGDGFTNDALLESVSNAPIRSSGNFLGEYKYGALFARINYNWKNKYILNLNARRDGSSRFGPGRQFGNFGSLGGAWIFSEESWVKNNLNFLSLGKIRGSYGTTGGDQVGNYQYLSQWGFGRFNYNNVLPLTPLNHTDSLIHWQVNRKTEIALNLSFLSDRISLETVWYRNRCNNQLVQFPTPIFTGFQGVTSNSPADVENTGWEFNLSAQIFSNKAFKWLSKLNVGINRNKLIAYPNLSQSPYASSLAVGYPLHMAYLLHYTGVNRQTGLYTFQDKNHDDQISIDYSNPSIGDDRYPFDLTPKFDGGITQEFDYKQWQLSLFFYFKKQKGLNALGSLNTPGDMSNQPIEVYENHWQKSGDAAQYAKFTANPSDNSYQYFSYNSDGIYTDASFIRLQNLSLSYTFSEKYTKKVGIETLKIYLQAQNLLIITHYKGLDPEIQIFTALPSPRILTAGLSCNF